MLTLSPCRHRYGRRGVRCHCCRCRFVIFSPYLSVQIEKERLQGQVVNSPQRILREVADQQQALDQVMFVLLLS